MKPFYIKRKKRKEAVNAVTDLVLNRNCEVLTPVTKVVTPLKRTVAVMYYAKLRKVD